MKLRFYLRGLGIGMLVTALILGISMKRQTATMTDEQVMKRAAELGMEQKYDSGTLADMKKDESAGKDEAADQVAANDPAKEAGEHELTDTSKGDNAAQSPADSGKAEDQKDAAAEDAKNDTTAKTEDKAKTDAVADSAKTEADEKVETDASKTDSAKAEEKKDEAADSAKTDDKEKTDASADNAKTDDKKEVASDTTKTDDKKDTSSDNKKTEEIKTDEIKTDDQREETTTAASGDGVNFEIKNGEGSDVIAKHLQEAGIIKDAAAFDKFLCQKGYDRKLRTGSRMVKAGMTDEEIADALMHLPEK